MNKLKYHIDKVIRKTLQLYYGFDKWHISPLSERPYATDIISYCNNIQVRNSFAEIGCGLGDIIRNVRFNQRAGYDMDTKVLKAAAILKSVKTDQRIKYRQFIFPDTPLTDIVDILVMVNWIHHVQPDTLRNKLAHYFNNNLSPGGKIIVDTVQDPAYKYNHQITFLTNELNCSLVRIGNYARQREVWAIKKHS